MGSKGLMAIVLTKPSGCQFLRFPGGNSEEESLPRRLEVRLGEGR